MCTQLCSVHWANQLQFRLFHFHHSLSPPNSIWGIQNSSQPSFSLTSGAWWRTPPDFQKFRDNGLAHFMKYVFISVRFKIFLDKLFIWCKVSNIFVLFQPQSHNIIISPVDVRPNNSHREEFSFLTKSSQSPSTKLKFPLQNWLRPWLCLDPK